MSRHYSAQDAIYDAIREIICGELRDGAAVVRFDDGTYQVIPPAWLTDVSYTERGHIRRYKIYDAQELPIGDTDVSALSDYDMRWLAAFLSDDWYDDTYMG